MSVITFIFIVALVAVLWLGCGSFLIIKNANNPTSNTLLNLGILIFVSGAIVVTLVSIVVIFAPCNKVEIDRMSIAVESIDAYDIDDYQQYKITTEDGVVYDTALTSWDEIILSWDVDNNFVFVEDSEDNEFHLYNITYQKQIKIASLTLTGDKSTKLVLGVPHEYYVLHTGEQDNNTTRIYTSNE